LYNPDNHIYCQLRNLKEALLQQHGRVFWMCGLSGSGKSTLAFNLDRVLTDRGFLCQVIDGDIIRGGLSKGLGFSVADRYENLRRVAEVAKLFSACGVITFVSFISPTTQIRLMAREIIGIDDFKEIFINAPVEICEYRDTKGLYKKARAGEIKDFTGIDSPFEPPECPDLILNTKDHSVDESTDQLLAYVLPLIAFKELS
jgi:adenylylsulfate kinase